MELIKVTEAAERLDCSRYHVYDLMADGLLRRFNVSRTPGARPKWRVAVEDVDSYIASSEVPLPQRAAS